MQIVLLTALGVGGATMFGALIGFLFKNISRTFSDVILSLAAGVMLAAAVNGLIMPSLEIGGKIAPLITVLGIICGALCLNFLDKIIPNLYNSSRLKKENAIRINRVLLFVTAIAIHNFPEGVAAGVGFGNGNISQALTVAGGIALQNIPEGMVIIAPMIASGISPGKTLCYAMLTGVVEIAGTLTGYCAVRISAAILPFALAFAGGTMLYVISEDMIPESHAHGNERAAAFALLIGFCLMIVMDYYMK